LKTFEKYWFLISFFILLVTGVIFVYFRDFAPKSDDPFIVSTPWQSWMISLHVVAAPIFIFWLGWISITHTMNRLNRRMKRGKRTGLINVGLLMIAVMSGYLIQVITHEKILIVTSNLHLYISLTAFILVLVHQVISNRAKKHGKNK